MPLRKDLGRIYARRFNDRDREDRGRLWAVLCDAYLARLVPPGATVLDLGAGDCGFVNHVRAARRIAVDANPDLLDAAGPGVEAHVVPLERLGEAVGDGSVDFVLASNVLEHLRGPEALIQVLDAVFRALRPGGLLVVLQPNVRAVGPRFWDYVDHTLPLTDRGMAEALTLAGFAVVRRQARFLPYTVKSRYPRWSWLVRLYLALPPAQWLLGEQMLVTARRPS